MPHSDDTPGPWWLATALDPCATWPKTVTHCKFEKNFSSLLASHLTVLARKTWVIFILSKSELEGHCQYATLPRILAHPHGSTWWNSNKVIYPKPQTKEYATPSSAQVDVAIHLPRYSYHVASRIASQNYTIKLRFLRPNSNKIWYIHQDPVETFEMVSQKKNSAKKIKGKMPEPKRGVQKKLR